MFRQRPDSRPATISVEVEGRRILVPVGASAAAAVLVAGFSSIRETPVPTGQARGLKGHGAERGPYCMMGICFECLAEIDGVSNRQSCMVAAQTSMRIRRQRGARAIEMK